MSKKLSLANISASTVLSMSSLEIAELTGKRHDNVVRDIEKMFKDLEIDALNYEAVYKDAYKRDKKCYNLDKHYTMVLITGYSPRLRDVILRRMTEMEKEIAALKKQLEERKDSKQLFRRMTDTIKEVTDYNGTKIDGRTYSQEADMINMIIFGMKSSLIRQVRRIPKDALIRDYMTGIELEAINRLQTANAAYFEGGIPIEQRKTMLQQIYARYCAKTLTQE